MDGVLFVTGYAILLAIVLGLTCWITSRRRPRTFAEYMNQPHKRAQRDHILAMCDELERRQ